MRRTFAKVSLIDTTAIADNLKYLITANNLLNIIAETLVALAQIRVILQIIMQQIATLQNY